MTGTVARWSEPSSVAGFVSSLIIEREMIAIDAPTTTRQINKVDNL